MTEQGRPQGESFLQKVLLLVVTAVLTSLVAPFVNSRIADERERRSKAEAAAMAKQAAIIRAQEEFIGELERLLFEHHAQAAAVAWYQSQEPDKQKAKQAFDIYDEQSWKFLQTLTAMISKAQRLSSEIMVQRLWRHYRDWMNLDARLVRMQREHSDAQAWTAMLEEINKQAGESMSLVDALSKEFGLKPTEALKAKAR